MMKKSNKNGQAAIEFLVTYGWAILGVLIVIGMLSYFGIFNTQRYVNDVCYFGDQMSCEDSIAYSDGWASLKLRNNFGVNIDITDVVLKSDYGIINCGTDFVLPKTEIQSGSVFEINCNINNTLSVNNKIKFKTTVSFTRSGSSNVHNQTGDITIAVQKQEGTCTDNLKNCHGLGCEPDVDCGNVCLTECAYGKYCFGPNDCADAGCNAYYQCYEV